MANSILGGGRSAAEETREIWLNLTPMIDIMTCLLFFLLLGYKSQSLMLESAKNMILPPSRSDQGLVALDTVTVTQTEIRVNDAPVMFLKNGQPAPGEVDGDRLLPLYQRVQRLLEFRKPDPSKAFFLLLGDRRLKADIITKVMKTCGLAGMPNFKLGVARP